MDYPTIPAAGRLPPWRRSGQDKVINQSSNPDSDLLQARKVRLPAM
jgi:hypothetical protein